MQSDKIDMYSVYQKLNMVFENAKRYHFETGMYSEFSWELVHYLDTTNYHQWVLDLLSHMILVWEWTYYDVPCEACRWVGHADHGAFCGNASIPLHIESTDRRRRMLEYVLLNAKNPAVRDAAGLGLASIDDFQSIPALHVAISKEDNDMLKQDLQQVLDQLIETEKEKRLSYKDYLGE